MKIINRDSLKILALIFMLSDHLWATIVPGNNWMTYVGRMAFPIFAFQIAEGYYYTSNFKKYAQRLFIFALISEIPFNLFYSSSWIDPFHQNVIFTLFLGLLAIRGADIFLKDKNFLNFIKSALAILGATFAATFGFTDYSGMGVLTIVLFYLSSRLPFTWVLRIIGMYLLNIHYFYGQYIPLELFGRTFEFQTQGFALLALIPIAMYNGKKGSGSPIMQYATYIFYPVHMLILYFLFAVI